MKYTHVKTSCGLIIANMVLILEVPNPKWRLLSGKDLKFIQLAVCYLVSRNVDPFKGT